MPQLAKHKKYTYKDYCTWQDDERWELIKGVPYMMSPAPLVTHQAVVISISSALYEFLEGKPCNVFCSPIDVRFSSGENEDTVVQPDIVVVCDRNSITPKGIVGPPALVVEVLSPSTALYDMGVKLGLYEAHGVSEYWVVSPDERLALRHSLQDGRYARASFPGGMADSLALEGFALDLDALFASLDELGLKEDM